MSPKGDNTGISHADRLAAVMEVMAETPVNEAVRRHLRAKLEVAPTPKDVIHDEMCMKVYRYRPKDSVARGAVLMIPSLINGPYILDLRSRHSLAEGLTARGIDTYIVQWEMPDVGGGGIGLSDLVDVYLPRAVRRVKRFVRSVSGSGDRAERLVLLGQCLGGTLAAMSACRHDGLSAGLVMLTAPFDFEPECILKGWTGKEVFYLEAVMDAYPDMVPHGLLQIAFPLLDPRALVTKYHTLYDKAHRPTAVKLFQALDLWTKDGPPVPGRFLREVVEEFYWANRLMRKSMMLSGRPVDLMAYDGPVLNLYAEQDNIVPQGSAACLDRLMRKVETVLLPTGHVTTVVANPLRHKTYDRVAEFASEAARGS